MIEHEDDSKDNEDFEVKLNKDNFEDDEFQNEYSDSQKTNIH